MCFCAVDFDWRKIRFLFDFFKRRTHNIKLATLKEHTSILFSRFNSATLQSIGSYSTALLAHIPSLSADCFHTRCLGLAEFPLFRWSMLTTLIAAVRALSGSWHRDRGGLSALLQKILLSNVLIQHLTSLLHSLPPHWSAYFLLFSQLRRHERLSPSRSAPFGTFRPDIQMGNGICAHKTSTSSAENPFSACFLNTSAPDQNPALFFFFSFNFAVKIVKVMLLLTVLTHCLFIALFTFLI